MQPDIFELLLIIWMWFRLFVCFFHVLNSSLLQIITHGME